ncbi:Alkaline phosphatase, tissue-nonspecific isozyme [Habropoda laboriosa]|uniref:alkaline phosphatase n=1 Tax=Habropoda laboriosa TaxID=597456 RepID=A0A0L7QZV5_9HYME|nr:Alkaline phosphatase, tissue-nonspecific isozyme [Habropoda laboriosa]
MDAQVGESSACATALLCGVKANYETVGLDSSARFENCYSSFGAHVPSLINWAQEQGKSTGLVTTTRVTHATPAALYAHTVSRYWEDDGKVPLAARTSCKDIARQLLEDEPGRNIDVILGGGRRHFVPKVIQDPEEPDKEGRRLDGRNLIEEWSRNHRLRNVPAKYVANKEQFENVDPRKVNHLLGLFSYSHMDFDVDRNTNGSGDPSLAEMTIKALRILAKNPEGYFLFVEGGRIDHAHHYNNAYRALDETLTLEEAVRAVMKEVDLSETLLVVTADHSHVLTLGGLATHRGNPIFETTYDPGTPSNPAFRNLSLPFRRNGEREKNYFQSSNLVHSINSYISRMKTRSDSKVSDVDGKPYTTLLYSNGPGYTQPRNILREAGKDSIQTAGVPRAWATHGGEDVPVFAIGPLANVLFSGSIDQSYIPHAISYASCLGHHASRCSRDSTSSNDTMSVPISCPSAEPNSAAISSDVMNDQARNPPTKSGASLELASSRSLTSVLLPLILAILPCSLEGTS